MKCLVYADKVCALLILREMGGRQFVVEGPDSLQKETVLESDELGLDTLVSSGRWQRDRVYREVGGVRHCTAGYTEAVFVIDVLYLRQRDTYDVLCCLYYLLQGSAVCYSAVSIPDNDATGQDTLNDASVEYDEDGEGESSSHQSFQEVGTLLDYFGQ